MTTNRIASIDYYRALIMLLMIFVIDASSVTDLPAWLGHAAADEDRLGFADIIFPCFMFIIGLSIPYAIRQRRRSGSTTPAIAFHIILRTIALLIMGLMVVNMDNMNDQQMAISKPLWMLLMVVAIYFVWNEYPEKNAFGKIPKQVFQAAGVGLLAVLAYLYQGYNGWMGIHWWGILGLLGWSYLLSAFVYLLVGQRIAVVAVLSLGLLLLNINEFIGGFNFRIIISASNYFSVMLGMLCTLIVLSTRPKLSSAASLWTLVVLAVALLVFGVATRSIWEISKIRATPSWTAICGAISIAVYVLIQLLMKLKLVKHVFKPIAAGGYATLSCYFNQYLVYALMGLFSVYWPDSLREGMPGLVRSLVFAVLIIWLTALASKLCVKLKI